MAEFVALPLWTDAYLADTTHLTTTEHGAYLLLLIAAWRSKDCSLPNDDKLLARYSGLSPAQWKKMKPTILEFFSVENDRLFQFRLIDEREAVKQKSKKASHSARARWLKTKKNGNANASAKQCSDDAPLPLPLPLPLPSEEKIHKKDDGKYSDEFEVFWKAYPSSKSKSGTSKAYEKIISSIKATHEQLLKAAINHSAELEGKQNKYPFAGYNFINQDHWKDYLEYTAEPAQSTENKPDRISDEELNEIFEGKKS